MTSLIKLAIIAVGLIASVSERGFARELPQLFKADVVFTGDVTEPFVQYFFLKIEEAQPLFSLMPAAKSDIEALDFNFNNVNSISVPLGYNRFTKKIFITSLQDCDSEVPISYILPLTLHEVAHSIFWPNLMISFPGESLPAREEALDLDVCKSFFKIAGPRCTQGTVSLHYLSEPFDELYADTAAVLADNDPQAIAKPLQACHKDLPQNLLRDFSYRYKVNWSAVRKPFSYDSHHVFDTVRSFIWTTYLQKKTVGIDKKKKILNAVFEASVEVIRELHEQKLTNTAWDNIDQKSLNQRLIQAVSKRL